MRSLPRTAYAPQCPSGGHYLTAEDRYVTADEQGYNSAQMAIVYQVTTKGRAKPTHMAIGFVRLIAPMGIVTLLFQVPERPTD